MATDHLHTIHSQNASHVPPTRAIKQTITQASGQLHYLFKHTQKLQRLNQLFQQWLNKKHDDPNGFYPKTKEYRYKDCNIANLREDTLIIATTHPTTATMMITQQQDILEFFQHNDWPCIKYIKIAVYPATQQFNPLYPLCHPQSRVKFTPYEMPVLSEHARAILKNTAKTLTAAAMQPLRHVLEQMAMNHGPRNNNDNSND